MGGHGAVPSCVTLIALVIPPPEIVISPVLVAPVFACTSMKIVPSPVPRDGETLSHDALLDAVHDTFEPIFADVPPAKAGGFQDVRDTSSDAAGGIGGCCAPSCVTVIVLVIPPPATVTIPVLV